MKVGKTKCDRLVFTLHVGGFRVHETWLNCGACGNREVYRAAELKRLFPKKGNFGFDIIVHIGRRLFLDNRTLAEVKAELAAGRVTISESEVDFLGRKFIVYLSLCHQRAAARLKDMMELNGGYMLHIDATCESDSPLLLTGIDAITSIVLWNRKIPSEKAAHVIPFLREINDRYGRPLLVVMDMSNGFENAVREVFGENMDMLICHFHFLRDLGKDLFGLEYDLIRKRLRTHGVGAKLRYRAHSLRSAVDENPGLVDRLGSEIISRKQLTKTEQELLPAVASYALIQWAFDGKKTGGGYGFPFDHPHLEFATRLREVFYELGRLQEIFGQNTPRHNRPLFKTANDIRKLIGDRILLKAVEKIGKKIEVFDALRKAMRIAPQDDTRGLNDNGRDEPIGKIEERVKKFRRYVVADPRLNEETEYRKMIAQIDKYWERLFADPVTVDTPAGRISIQPQRTNNIMEQFFRKVKRGHRRRTGNNSMTRTLKAMNANTTLIKNLENQQYLDILLNGKESLEDVFAEIDGDEVGNEMTKLAVPEDKMPTKIRKIIKLQKFPSKMVKSVRTMVDYSKSNLCLEQ